MKLTLGWVDRISNPLADIPKSTLLRNVENFASDNDLTDITHDLQKGALIAQNPAAFEELEELDTGEKDALRYEVLHKWKHTFQLYLTVIVCSIGAAVQ